MEYLVSIDRESFKKEIDALKQSNKKLLDQIGILQESDRELKRECMSYLYNYSTNKF